MSRNVFVRRFSSARLFTAGRILHIVRRKRMGIEKLVVICQFPYHIISLWFKESPTSRYFISKFKIKYFSYSLMSDQSNEENGSEER